MTNSEQKHLYDYIGNQIKTLRKRAGFSQEVLADKLELSRVSIVNIEKGRQHTTIHLIIELSKIFNVNINYFVPDVKSDLNSAEEIKSKVREEAKNFKSSSGQTIDTKRLINFLDGISSDKND
jgi:transcriptional regulator with XRE-family HTH domain